MATANGPIPPKTMAPPPKTTAASPLPPGGETKNLQLVLHARVIGNTPAQPDLVAAHVW